MGVELQIALKVKQSQKLQTALQVQTDLVCEASPQEVQIYLEELEQQGDIALDIGAAEADIPLEDELGVFDAEWDFSDEDTLSIEHDEDLQAVGGVNPFLSDDAYVLKVYHNPRTGQIEIDIPETGGEIYRGVKLKGNKALNKLDQRRAAYCAVAEWLMKADAEKLAVAPDEFLKKHQKIEQKKFIKDFCPKIDKASFSKYLGGARLAWRVGSIPLRSLFND